MRNMFFYLSAYNGKNPDVQHGYYIVFETPEALAKVSESLRKEIKSICYQLVKNDKTGFYNSDEIEIEFIDFVTEVSLVGHKIQDAN